MNTADAAELLTLAAAFDRRTIGEADARAWAAALHAVPLDHDTRAAVARHYAETREWLTPAHVTSTRARIRAERLARHTDPIPAADPDDPAAYRAALLGDRAAVATGQAPPTEYRALTTGDPAPNVAAFIADHRPGQMPPALRADLAQQGIGTRRVRFPELAVPCPRVSCRARRHMPCKRPSGVELRNHTHPQRQDAYAATQSPDR